LHININDYSVKLQAINKSVDATLQQFSKLHGANTPQNEHSLVTQIITRLRVKYSLHDYDLLSVCQLRCFQWWLRGQTVYADDAGMITLGIKHYYVKQ